MPTVNSLPARPALIAPSKSHGGALLTALFIMTLVAIVATAMSSRLQVDIYRTRLILNHDKLYFASQAVTFWAMSELGDAKKKFSATDGEGMVSSYPRNMGSIYPSVTLSGGIYDLQGRFNLNNLSNKKYILGFINLISATAAQMTAAEKMNLALAINNWVSPYDLGVGEDNFLSYYLHQKPPYHPSRQLMTSSSELRLIKDVSPKIFLALQPYVTALPDLTAININTASKQVLMSLNNTMNEQKVDEFIELRGKNGFKRIEKANDLLKKLNVANDQITLESAYFLSVAHASIDNFNFTVYTLLKRNRDKKGKITVNILRESFNVF
ncbi:MAG: type II secretion system minor pseudopilin GspK [Legionella sp.]|uniref:type II secretion system minor pseudopilin GspK n=1 Tax=Legionella sp. TaxID=459 RepID=UPI00284A3773|nr:type II secretion system minor pseudopilin GspK [Legionella sp.]